MDYNLFLFKNQWLFWLLIFWSIVWKGIALWQAAKNNHKWWFLAILVINSIGILEIIYIFIFGRKKKETKNQIS